MVAVVAFHIVMSLLGLGIVFRVVPSDIVGNVLGYVHKTIGITTPAPRQTRTIALVWIGSTLIIADGCVLLLVVIASSLR